MKHVNDICTLSVEWIEFPVGISVVAVPLRKNLASQEEEEQLTSLEAGVARHNALSYVMYVDAFIYKIAHDLFL